MPEQHWTESISDPTWEHIKQLRVEQIALDHKLADAEQSASVLEHERNDLLRRLECEAKLREAAERRERELEEKVLHWRGLYERTQAECDRLKGGLPDLRLARFETWSAKCECGGQLRFTVSAGQERQTSCCPECGTYTELVRPEEVPNAL